jgi:hypothetical protein
MKGEKKDYFEFDYGKIINLINYKHLPLIILILIGLAINIYYFNANKAVWWDEAEYLSFVNYATKGIPHSLWEGRAVIYPIILSLISLINPSESFLKIGLILINLLTIFSCYILLKKIFDKKIAFFSTLLFETSFLFLFFQIRFLTEIPSTMFILLSLYFFLNRDLKSKILAGIFVGLAIGTRFTSLFIIPAMMLYNLLSKSKIREYAWIPSIMIGFLPIIIFDFSQGNTLLYSLIFFITKSVAHSSVQPWDFYILDIFYTNPFIAPFFLIGLIKYLKLNNKKLLIISFFIIYFLAHSITSHKEDRYILPIMPFYCLIAVQGVYYIYEKITIAKKNKIKNTDFKEKIIMFFRNKILINIIIILFFSYSIYNSFIIADPAISAKSASYIEVKQAGEFLKNYAGKEEVIISNTPQANYYSEREMINFPANSSELYSLLGNNENINYFLISLYEGLPEYYEEFLNREKFKILNTFDLINSNQTKVLVIKYLRQ